jgi:hypothetical protein
MAGQRQRPCAPLVCLARPACEGMAAVFGYAHGEKAVQTGFSRVCTALFLSGFLRHLI